MFLIIIILYSNQKKNSNTCVLVRVPLAAAKHLTKKKKTGWGAKCLCSLQFQTIVHHWRMSGQERRLGWNLEAGSDAEAMKVDVYCLLMSVLLCFLVEIRAVPPTMG